ncbi:ferritin-like domain-containing protein [Burkholderia plantarii]|uniref:ferritin-like domain-containing protein n=1 Tax=Burkholderia plantarii TaxID=41899 RepID=UPI0006D8C072|nr:ferritin-like domain-containing protein [Burkholderia plantarii]ALK33785.1 hypothetical protein bpln_2g15590 [Burkholderia plantarii]
MTTSSTMLGKIPENPSQIVNRELKYFLSDVSAVRALLQAAVNVELFTIPLYMSAMKSIQGTHAINAQDVDYYKGRVWPGRSIGRIPANDPQKSAGDNAVAIANQSAYNTIFSVFIDEMLHLQMASNLCATLGLAPDFNSPALQDQRYNWTCYGADQTTIPHIIDLTDLNTPLPETSITLKELTPSQLALFMIIEQNDELAQGQLKPEGERKYAYFPEVPFDGWKAHDSETDLPMFGTISWMYYCLLQYTTIQYTDGVTLWEKMFAGQRDLFNSKAGTHPMAEYPKMPSQIGSASALQAQLQAIEMILAICDQGEGGISETTIKAYLAMVHETARQRGVMLARPVALLEANVVLDQFQPDAHALATDYPSYDDVGKQLPDSDDAIARVDNGKIPHYDRFALIAEQWIGNVTTWRQWHAAGKKWTAEMLTTADYDESKAPANIPKPQQVADALNALKLNTPAAVLDNVAQGALAGITTVLSKSWSDPSVEFPFPSMVGSGDRIALFWAVYGETPTLRAATDAPVGVQAGAARALNHACQSLSLDGSGGADCAAQATYHSCKGSNLCATQGGCGFVQSTQGGGNCSSSNVQLTGAEVGGGCGAPTLYSAPADNKCGGYGGCAVPISASQLYPKRETLTMQLYKFDPDGHPVELTDADGNRVLQQIRYGDSVYDTAWKAVETVRAHQDPNYKPQDTPPPATDLRIALPPST